MIDRPRLHAPGRRRAPPAAARARRGPVHALRLRRAVDGEDRQARRGSRRRCCTTTSPPRRRTSSPRWRRRRRSWRQRTAPDPSLPPLEQLVELARRLPRLDRGERGQLRQDDPLGGRGARGAGDARPRARRHRAADRRRAARRRAGDARRCGRRCAAGCGSWTAPAWTGSSTATSTGETLHGLLLGTLLGAVLAAGESGLRLALPADLLEVDDEDERARSGRSRPASPARRSRGRAGSTSTRRPPSFMPSTPWSQPGMTMPWPSGNVERLAAAVPGGVELRAVLVAATPTYWTLTVSPALAFGPVPFLRSLITSSSGGVGLSGRDLDRRLLRRASPVDRDRCRSDVGVRRASPAGVAADLVGRRRRPPQAGSATASSSAGRIRSR